MLTLLICTLCTDRLIIFVSMCNFHIVKMFVRKKEKKYRKKKKEKRKGRKNANTSIKLQFFSNVILKLSVSGAEGLFSHASQVYTS